MLAESRTVKGDGEAGIASVGVADVEVAQEVFAETQSAILPYLDTLRWVFIAVALIGVAVAIHAPNRRLEPGPAKTGWIATFFTSGPPRKALGLLLAAMTIALFLLNFRRAGERAGRLAGRLSASEKNHDIQRQMPAAAPPIAMLWFSACAIGSGSFRVARRKNRTLGSTGKWLRVEHGSSTTIWGAV